MKNKTKGKILIGSLFVTLYILGILYASWLGIDLLESFFKISLVYLITGFICLWVKIAVNLMESED